MEIMGTGPITPQNITCLSQGVPQPAGCPAERLRQQLPVRTLVSSDQSCGKAWLPNHTVTLPHLLPFPLHLCASSFLLAALVLPLPAAKVSIPGNGSFLASFSCCGDSGPSKGMSVMMASPLQGNRTQKNRETTLFFC